MDRTTLESHLRNAGIDYVLVQFVDIHGSPKVKLMPRDAAANAVEPGAGFAGGAVWGMGQTAASHDMMARIDLASYTPVPWQPGLARFASDLYVDDQRYPYCPRVNLQRVLAAARTEGYVFNVGVEPEHFLVTRDGGTLRPWDPANVDTLIKPCYDFKGMSGAYGYLRDMNDALRVLGWGGYQSDHEDANGQYEINFRYADALTTADRFIFFKMMAGEYARRHGAIATFMPKPFADRTGSGAHMHYHLADARSGENLFAAQGKDPRGLGLSPLAYHFLGGVLTHARALCAITSPTVNCYKRLQVGAGLTGTRSGFTWTPAFITYGDNNRTQMIRTPEPGHVEDRSVSSAFNPYLAMAAYISAGLDGVRRKIDPGEPRTENSYAVQPEEETSRAIRLLPQSLDEALDELEQDEVVRSALGPIAGELLRLKRAEWDEYHRQITPWEIDRLLTML